MDEQGVTELRRLVSGEQAVLSMLDLAGKAIDGEATRARVWEVQRDRAVVDDFRHLDGNNTLCRDDRLHVTHCTTYVAQYEMAKTWIQARGKVSAPATDCILKTSDK